MISDFEHVAGWTHAAEALGAAVLLTWALAEVPTSRNQWRCLLCRPYVSGLNPPPPAPAYTTEPGTPFDWASALGLDTETLAFEALYADSGLGEIVEIVTLWRQAVCDIAQEVHVTEERVCEVLRGFVDLGSDQ